MHRTSLKEGRLVAARWRRRDLTFGLSIRCGASDGRATGSSRRSADAQRGRVEVVEASRVDRHHRPVWTLTAREGAHAADLAEQVVDDLLAELVVAEGALSLLQRERARRHEREQGPVRAQMEQLHCVTGFERSTSTHSGTAPQWQPPDGSLACFELSRFCCARQRRRAALRPSTSS